MYVVINSLYLTYKSFPSENKALQFISNSKFKFGGSYKFLNFNKSKSFLKKIKLINKKEIKFQIEIQKLDKLKTITFKNFDL